MDKWVPHKTLTNNHNVNKGLSALPNVFVESVSRRVVPAENPQYVVNQREKISIWKDRWDV